MKYTLTMLRDLPIKFLLLLWSVSAFNLYGQAKAQSETPYAKLVAGYFREMRLGKENKTFPSTTDESSKITSLAGYLNDTARVVRLKSSKLLGETGLKSTDSILRRRSVQLLVVTLQKKDNLKVSVVLSILKRFGRRDFEPVSKDSLISFLIHGYPDRDRLLKLIGFVGGPEDINKVKELSQPGNASSMRWAALLAMARLSDTNALSDVVQRARKLKIGDDLVDQVLPDLIYTHQRQAIDFAVELLLNDELACESANNDKPIMIPCGYRVMEQLAPAIKGYPLTLDAAGDIKTNDYKEALATVRQWFEANRDSYQINNSTY